MRARARRTEAGHAPARGPQPAMKSRGTGPAPAIGTLAASARSAGTWAVSPADVAVLQRQVGNQATAAVLTPRKAAPVAPGPEAIQHAPGRPLDPPIRAKLEASLGADLSAVRIHTDEAADRSASSLGAKAYTIGSHIAFASGQFAPESADGLHTLGHEVAHVVQQVAHRATGTDRGDGIQVSQPGDPLEREADATAETVASKQHSPAGALSHPARIGGATPMAGTVVQRLADTLLEQSNHHPARNLAERFDEVETGPMGACVTIVVLWKKKRPWWSIKKGRYQKIRGFHGSGGVEGINFDSLFDNVPDGPGTLIIVCYGSESRSQPHEDRTTAEEKIRNRLPNSNLMSKKTGNNYRIDRTGKCTPI
jgi:hypothetical protein